MNRRNLLALTSFAGLGLAVVLGSIAFAEPAKDAKPADSAKPQLPPGMTEDDLKAYMEASTPGKMHKMLAGGAGEWTAKCTSWMAPDTDPVTSDGSAKGTAIMGGRFLQLEFKSEMMGEAFTGLGLYGYDNVAKKFASTWIDSMGTAMLQGTGDLSEDGKVLTWKYSYNCPIAKKLVTMREVETFTSANSRKLEMFGPDPKSGKEYKMMVIELTRKGDAPAKE
jgi:hypothetical protein